MKGHLRSCPGRYCGVVTEESLQVAPRSLKILSKSILLDKYEDCPMTEDDPLALKGRKFYSLDYLMAKLPKLWPSSFYNEVRVCTNCLLAYSIIDFQRLKHNQIREITIKDKEMNKSVSNMQTRVSQMTQKYFKTISNYKSKANNKLIKDFAELKGILVPVGQSRMSRDARMLLNHMIPDVVDSEEDDKMQIKETKTSLSVNNTDVCELARSITDKLIIQHRVVRRMRGSKTLPKIYHKYN